MDQPLNPAISTTVSQVLGIEPQEIQLATDFHLDLNASPEDLNHIKNHLEQQLDITLPAFEPGHPATVADLQTLVDDSLL
ncbi:hypothetical protein A2W24_04725 [Microgenomates group bacterium RBG_16_45_19]|nr:MAG: hypothetical protein A2W24_04725 [Microgenomates group bacterium RBG_16_45_19]